MRAASAACFTACSSRSAVRRFELASWTVDASTHYNQIITDRGAHGTRSARTGATRAVPPPPPTEDFCAAAARPSGRSVREFAAGLRGLGPRRLRSSRADDAKIRPLTTIIFSMRGAFCVLVLLAMIGGGDAVDHQEGAQVHTGNTETVGEPERRKCFPLEPLFL